MTTDRVIQAGILESTTSTGTGTLDLDGAATGWNRFRTFFDDGDSLVYVRRAADGSKEQLVRGLISYGTGAGGRDQLTVTHILKSSDGGASPTAIDWIAGDNPCAVFCASAEDLLDSALRLHYGAAKPVWFKKGLWAAAGAGATARKLYWYDGADDIEIATINETANTISFGGVTLTGATTVTGTMSMSGAQFRAAQGANIASAASIDLAAATGNFVDITGTTSITTSLGTAPPGTYVKARFTGSALTLSHVAATLLPNGGNSIQVRQNDTAGFMSLGSGNWVCVDYQRYQGGPVDGWQPFEKATPSSAASYTKDSIPTWANRLRITVFAVPASDGVQFDAIFRKSSGTDITSYNTGFMAESAGSSSVGAADSQSTAAIAAAVQNDANTGGVLAIIQVEDIQGSRYKMGTITVISFESGGGLAVLERGFQIKDTGTITGVKLLFASGNIASSRIKVEIDT